MSSKDFDKCRHRYQAGDIVFAKAWNKKNIFDSPKIIVLEHKDSNGQPSGFKLRRAWRLLPPNTSKENLSSIVANVLSESKFSRLRKLVGDKCPTDNDLTENLFAKFNNLSGDEKSEELLLSTTYKTEEGKLRFSLHKSSSIVGIVAYVSSHIKY